MKPRRLLPKITEPERWKQYKDTDFYFSDQGRAKRIIKGVEYEVGYFSPEPARRTSMVKIDNKGYKVKNIVYELFKGQIPEGYCIVHKSMKHDDSIYNLEAVPRKEHASRTGKKGNAQKVVDLDRRVIYRSAHEASKKLHCSRSSICAICLGYRKKPIVNVAWWDSVNQKAYRGRYRKYECKSA